MYEISFISISYVFYAKETKIIFFSEQEVCRRTIRTHQCIGVCYGSGGAGKKTHPSKPHYYFSKVSYGEPDFPLPLVSKFGWVQSDPCQFPSNSIYLLFKCLFLPQAKCLLSSLMDPWPRTSCWHITSHYRLPFMTTNTLQNPWSFCYAYSCFLLYMLFLFCVVVWEGNTDIVKVYYNPEHGGKQGWWVSRFHRH